MINQSSFCGIEFTCFRGKVCDRKGERTDLSQINHERPEKLTRIFSSRRVWTRMREKLRASNNNYYFYAVSSEEKIDTNTLPFSMLYSYVCYIYFFFLFTPSTAIYIQPIYNSMDWSCKRSIERYVSMKSSSMDRCNFISNYNDLADEM